MSGNFILLASEGDATAVRSGRPRGITESLRRHKVSWKAGMEVGSVYVMVRPQVLFPGPCGPANTLAHPSP